MNLNNVIKNIELKTSLLFNEYEKIKKKLAETFILQAQDEFSQEMLMDLDKQVYSFIDKVAAAKTAAKKSINKANEFIEKERERLFNKADLNQMDKYLNETQELMTLSKRINNLVHPLNTFWIEIELLYEKVLNEDLLDYSEDERDEFKFVFSESIANLFYKLLDKSEDGVVQLDAFEENILERGLVIQSIPSPTVLHSYEIKRLKDLAKRNGVELDLVQWTPENCTQIIFEDYKPKTPFKELDEEITTF